MLRVEARTSLGAFELDAAVAVPGGSCLALAGPSGAGKSTLLRVAAGLLRPQHGRVTCGEDVWLDTATGRLVAPELRACGYVFQDYALFGHMTAWQNVAYGLGGVPRAQRRPRALALLERFGIARLADERPRTLSGGERQRVALEGSPGAWLPAGFEVIAQRGASLGERLANAVRDVGEPLLLLGMDTPQVTRAGLRGALDLLDDPQTGAVLGPTDDGGYWTIGCAAPDPAVFDGVPMSSPATAERQRARLEALAVRVRELPTMRDVDTYEDAVAVATGAPWTRFAAALELITG